MRSRPIPWLALGLALARASALGASAAPAPGPAPGAAPPPPPPSQRLRYDEDYSYLRDASRRADFWDVLKYIPLDEAGDWYLSLGGEARWRYERFHDYRWNPVSSDDDGYLLQRYLVSADLHLGAHFRVFSQLQSSLENGRQNGPRPPDEDRLDLHQLFGDAVVPLASGAEAGSATLRLGRQELSYGSQRLVSVRESPNIRRAFDTIRGIVRLGGWRVDGFVGEPVEDDPGVFDDWQSTHTALWGAYGTHALAGGASLDLYYLGIWRRDATFARGTDEETRHSLGARLFGRSGAWDYNTEGVFQFGEFGHDGILAWTLASDTGYTLESMLFSPRLALKVNAISGDTNGHGGTLGTFDPLFPRGSYFGEAAQIWPANLIDVDAGFTLHLVPGLSFEADCDVFWRTSTRDGLYGSGGSVVRPDVGHARFVGTQLNAGLAWQVERHTEVHLAWTHFFSGPFIRDSGPDEDVDFAAAWLTYRF